MQKVLPAVVLGFVLFFIYQTPAEASSVAGQFAGFAGDFLQRFGEFLSGLFGGASETSP